MLNFENKEDFLEEQKNNEHRLYELGSLLREIGNFEKGPILVKSGEEISEDLHHYEVKDKEGTVFQFYNFLRTDPYKKNYCLLVKKQSEKATFTYNFVTTQTL